jgi:hypothetical protein
MPNPRKQWYRQMDGSVEMIAWSRWGVTQGDALSALIFARAELRRATFRDDVGHQRQQIGRCNHPAAAHRSRLLERHPKWVKLARHSGSGTPNQYGK